MSKDERLTTHVTGEVKETVEEMADELGLTTSAYLRMILLQHLREEGRIPELGDEEGNQQAPAMATAAN